MNLTYKLRCFGCESWAPPPLSDGSAYREAHLASCPGPVVSLELQDDKDVGHEAVVWRRADSPVPLEEKLKNSIWRKDMGL